jgi:mono/diheme cytochrome c family protein
MIVLDGRGAGNGSRSVSDRRNPWRIWYVLVAVLIAGGVSVGLAQDEQKIAAGEDLYNNYCSTCHGDGLVNSGQVFDLRRLDAGSRARFEKSVLGGKGQMPPWKGVLTDEDIDRIWHYIRANAHQK